MEIIIIKLLITIAVGAICGYILNKLKVPGGLLIGAMASAAFLSVVWDIAYMPDKTKIPVQMVAGAFIGCSLERSDLRRLPHIIKPAVIMLSALLVLNVAAGFIIYMTSPLDLLTSLMSTIPGGISDTPVIAADMGADGPKVAVMQLIRQILGIGVLPPIIYAWDKYLNRRKALLASSGMDNEELEASAGNKEARQKSKNKSTTAFILTCIVAVVFGLLGRMSGLPSATFVFPIIAVIILKLKFDCAYMPKWAKKAAQVLSGCYLGSIVGLDDVLELRYLLLPVLIIIAGYVLNCLITGHIISRTCGFGRKEGMLITTPAGASDMALISADLGVENTDVIILQVIRAVFVMTFFPQIDALLVNLLSM